MLLLCSQKLGSLRTGSHFDAVLVSLEWLGKDSIFGPPFGGLLRRLSGIPGNKERSSGVVEQMVQEFDRRSEFALALSPEGTRGNAKS